MHTVPNTPMHRRLVLTAYATEVLSDFLSDCALWGVALICDDQPQLTAIPTKLEDHPAGTDALNELGWRFEETFLQHHAPQWAFAGEDRPAGDTSGLDFRLAALMRADAMLATLHAAWRDIDRQPAGPGQKSAEAKQQHVAERYERALPKVAG